MPSTPNLLIQRIGRLDRIGQKNDITIHVPYLKNSIQQIFFDFYNTSFISLRPNGGLVPTPCHDHKRGFSEYGQRYVAESVRTCNF